MKKLFKKSIACIIAVMMIVTSVPFGGAIVAQAASTQITLTNYNQCGVLAAPGNATRYDSENRIITVCNDGQDSNFTIGFATFNVSSLSGKIITGANYDFSLSIAEGREDLGLKIYYPTQNIADFHASGQLNKTNASIWAGQDGADHIGNAKSYYGLQEIKSFDTVAGNTDTQSVDISEAIQWAVNNGKNNAAICFMLGGQGGIGAQDKNGNSNPERWSDTLVTISRLTLDVNYRDASALESACINFENKFNSDKIYKNVETAYTAYVNAKKAMIAKNYGASIDETSLANTLNNAVNNMTEWSYTAPNVQIRSTGDSNQSGDDYTQRQANVLYQSGAFEMKGDSVLVEQNKNDNTLLFNRKSGAFTFKVWASVKIGHPNQMVLVYDGLNVPEFPVVVQLDRTADNSPSERAWYGYCTLKSTDTENAGLTFRYPTYWKYTTRGNCDNGDLPWLYTGLADYSELRSDTDTTRNDGDHSNSDNCFTNIVQFTGSMADNVFSITRSPIWETYAYNDNNGDNSKYIRIGGNASSTTTDNIHYANTPIYIINYKVVREKMKSLNEQLALNVKTGNYTQGGARTVAQAIDKLTSVNINQNYASSVASGVTDYETAARNAVNAANSASFTADSEYEALCNNVDAMKLVIDKGNDPTNDKYYESESWFNFVSKYSDAITHLRGLANNSFNQSQARALNKALTDAYNALVEVFKFTFVDVNNNSTVTSRYYADAQSAMVEAPTNTSAKYEQTSETEHTKTEYTWQISSDSSVKVITEVANTSVTEPHSFQTASDDGNTYTCVCGAVLNAEAYNGAVTDAESIVKDENIYTTESFNVYKTVYDSSINQIANVHSQAELDEITNKLISAKTYLVKKAVTITFRKEIGGTVTEETFEKPYGQEITIDSGIKDANITKWTAETADGTSAMHTSMSSVTYVPYTDTVITVYADDAATSAVNTKQVIFRTLNGSVQEVRYVADFSEITAENMPAGKEYSFYTFAGWGEPKYSADGTTVYYDASYTFKSETDKCGVHFTYDDGRVKDYEYDAYIKLTNADSSKVYALSTTADMSGFITNIKGTSFHVPHNGNIYIIESNKTEATIGITGNYSTTTTDKRGVAVNAKFCLPEDAVKADAGYDVVMVKNDGTKSASQRIKCPNVNQYNEYTKSFTTKNTSVVSFEITPYVVYTTADGKQLELKGNMQEFTL